MSSVDRPEIFYELTKKEQRQLLEWCGDLKKVKNVNQNVDSYSIKHLFEKSKNGFYIPNGAMKGAMITSGFDCFGTDSNINLKFNVSQKSINQINKAIFK